MSDVIEATGTTKTDEILERLARLELLILNDRLAQLEGNEPTEDDDPEVSLTETVVPTRSAAAREGGAELAAPPPPLPLAARFEQFVDGLGLRNFRGREFTPYWSRVRNGVRNSAPPETLWKNIVPTLVVLQRFRDEFGSPVQLLSTYRSPAYNSAVGGASASQHKEFSAIDFTCSTGTPRQWAQMVKGLRGRSFTNPTGGTFTFRGGVGIYTSSSFVHVDTRGNDANWGS